MDVTDVLFVSFSPPVLATAERDRAALLGRRVRAERREGRRQLVLDREALEQVLAEVAKFVEPPSTY